MLERIWNVILGFVTVVSVVMITAIGVIAPLSAQLMIAGMLVIALTVRVLKRHSPSSMSATASEVGVARLATDEDLVDATLMATLDGSTGSFDYYLASKDPHYVTAHGAARPIGELF